MTCDGAVVNYSTLNMLGTDLYKKYYDNIKLSFKHPSSELKYISSPTHVIKLNLRKMQCLTAKCFVVLRDTYVLNIENLHILQQNMSLKIANKIRSAHIDWKKKQ